MCMEDKASWLHLLAFFVGQFLVAGSIDPHKESNFCSRHKLVECKTTFWKNVKYYLASDLTANKPLTMPSHV
jgi:hypothetical protein